MHANTRGALAGCAGVLAALGVATGLTQAASNTTATTTTPASTSTQTTTTPKAKPKPKATTKTITCKANLVETKPLSESSENFGTVTCAAPLGKGVQHDTSALTSTSTTAGSFSGGLKIFLNTGTVRGTFKLAFTVANKTITYTGTVKISSGTGEFAGVTGTGTSTGANADGVRSALTEKLTLRFPAKKTA